MNLNISAPKMQLTVALETYVKEKVQKIYTHFEITSVHVRLEHENTKNIAQIDVGVKGTTLHISESHSDMYAAIDKLVQRTHETLRRKKEKKQRRVA